MAGSIALLALALAPRLASAQARDSTTIVCKDGTTEQGAGGCGAHGGVDPVATKSTQDGARDARRPPRTGATIVICQDGIQSTAGNNACIHHGGIKSYPGQTGEVKAALRMEPHKSTVPTGLQAAPKSPTVSPAPAKADTARRTKGDTTRRS
jgi:hypothetical protein